MLAAIALSLVSLLAPHAKAGFRPHAHFGTPARAAYCTVDEQTAEDFRPKLFCWRPNDGYGVTLRYRGHKPTARYYDRPSPIVHSYDTLVGWRPRAYTLRFGRRWVLRCTDATRASTCRSSGSGVVAFTCISRTSGLTCANQLRHGFWLGPVHGGRRF
jgi:hypothetical protein